MLRTLWRKRGSFKISAEGFESLPVRKLLLSRAQHVFTESIYLKNIFFVQSRAENIIFCVLGRAENIKEEDVAILRYCLCFAYHEEVYRRYQPYRHGHDDRAVKQPVRSVAGPAVAVAGNVLGYLQRYIAHVRVLVAYHDG